MVIKELVAIQRRFLMEWWLGRSLSTKEFGWIRHKEFGNFQRSTFSEVEMMTRIAFGIIYCLAGMEICVMPRLVQTLEEYSTIFMVERFVCVELFGSQPNRLVHERCEALIGELFKGHCLE
jgi:hypothetical protein